ncbi:LOW QUALITY PROTEIN: eukaryotic translation initiation factor 5B [Monomorium pharaonis]|uniref:LOW QUALITY PROTEIN: eukaryotic translation initiation factor 5B n=1 Tax=Monomorium pharaonis TaxID=307658 RepID=UPI00174623DB|nr:LOW QUALITY PROTEIN: eukaryotic translation initiation factor 5B [Monomorium pharaonis]
MRLEAFSRRRRSNRGEFVRLFSSSGSCYPAPFPRGCGIRCFSASQGASTYIYRFKPSVSLDMTEQMAENNTDGVVDKDNEERLYLNTVVSDDENWALERSEEYEEDERKEEQEGEEGVYEMDEFFTRDEKYEREKERYEERSHEDEEAEGEGDAPPDDTTTVSTAEKPEEEVQQDVVGPDHVLAEIPVEVRINLSFCVILPVELLCLTTFVIF